MCEFKSVASHRKFTSLLNMHAEEIITVGHRPFSGQDFHMTDQKPL